MKIRAIRRQWRVTVRARVRVRNHRWRGALERENPFQKTLHQQISVSQSK